MAFYSTEETLDIIDFCKSKEELLFTKRCILEQGKTYIFHELEMIMDYIDVVLNERSQ